MTSRQSDPRFDGRPPPVQPKPLLQNVKWLVLPNRSKVEAGARFRERTKPYLVGEVITYGGEPFRIIHVEVFDQVQIGIFVEDVSDGSTMKKKLPPVPAEPEHLCGRDDPLDECPKCGIPPREVIGTLYKERARREAVNHPAHYGGQNNPYEAIKVIEAWGLGFCLGNAVKYISRAGKKESDKEVEDLKKALWYIQRRIEQIEQD